MRTLKKTLAVTAICLLGGLSLTACEGKKQHNTDGMNTDGMNTDGMADGMIDGGPNGLDFEVFLVGLIKNDTSDSSLPTTIDDKTFTDSMDPATFAPLFP